jgi:hypothetical protein
MTPMVGGWCPDGQYDVALVTVRRDQLSRVMPALKSNDLVSALGRDRLQLGFPGGGALAHSLNGRP